MREVVIDYSPQDYQREVHNDPTRFKVIIRGRRGGKTEEEIQGALKDTITVPGLHWITGPTFRQVKSIVWTRLKAIIHEDIDSWKVNEAEMYIEHKFIQDSKGIHTRLELKGVDKEDSLVGVGLRSLRCDEAALYRGDVWPKVFRPMLADHQAPAYFYTTPRGRNWLYDLYLKGVDPNETEWKSWRQSSTINKYLVESEILEMKKDMSERLYKQEVLAEFLDDSTGVFRGIRLCTVGELKEPVAGRLYVIGIDLAKSYDFTVLTVIDSVTREVVAFERFQDVQWREQKLRIQDLAKKWNNAICHIDSTGLGDPIYDDLQHAGVSIQGFKFSNSSKVALINQLIIAIEQRQITWPRELEVLTQELMDFDYSISKSGNIIYNAPEGKHDDCVISLALAVWWIRNELREAQQVNEQQLDNNIVDTHGDGELVYESLSNRGEDIIGGY